MTIVKEIIGNPEEAVNCSLPCHVVIRPPLPCPKRDGTIQQQAVTPQAPCRVRKPGITRSNLDHLKRIDSMRLTAFLATALLLAVTAPGRAEVFFLQFGKAEGTKRTVEVIADPAIASTDPTRLADIGNLQAWSKTDPRKPPVQLPLRFQGNRLVGEVALGSEAPNLPVSVAVVHRHRDGDGKLHSLFVKSVRGNPDALNQFTPIPELGMEIMPLFQEDGSITLQVLRGGKPLPESVVSIRDPESKSQGTPPLFTLKTDAEGRTKWTPTHDGTFQVFTRLEGESSEEAILTLVYPLEDSGTRVLLHKMAVAAKQNLLGPLVLFFFMGMISKIIKSDIRFPAEGYQLIVIFLLLAIGYEGGHDLRGESNLLHCLVPFGTGFLVNTLVSIGAVFLLLKVLRLDVPNSCALGALYGSDSAGLFAVSMALVNSFQLPKDGFMAAMLAVMEIPGILVGIILFQMLGRKAAAKQSTEPHPEPEHHAGGVTVVRRALTAVPKGGAHAIAEKAHKESGHGILHILLHELKSPGIYLLLGSILVGYLTVPSEYERTRPFFDLPFRGIMCIFLFENGMKAGEQLTSLGKGVWKLALFGTLFPLLMGLLAIPLAKAIGLEMGSAILFAALVSAPSNIAAPAAMRMAIPEANPSIYFTTGLGISFPFLVVLGVPFFYLAAQWVY